MKGISKLLIAYDGSAYSDAALNDLQRGGLSATLEAVVLTVAYVFQPPKEGEMLADDLVSPAAAEMVRPHQLRVEEEVKKALVLASQGASRVKADFPGWSVRAEADGGTPAWSVIDMAGALVVDLIVMGSHGHSSVGGRLILGSVSKRVIYEAPCSVRVARRSEKRREGPVRIVIGFNNSKDAEAAVDAVASRFWPKGSEARVIIVGPPVKPEMQGAADERLRAAGLVAKQVNRDGNPALVLIEEAENWDADSIFVGTRNIHGIQHLLHGSVSLAVAAGAHCSVEVVRPSKSTP
jgi:nucleotide-binding universal stress UspA family protein